MAKHELKTWPSYFQAIVAKKKTFEVRQHDRDYAVGDRLILREYDPEDSGMSRGRYTGQTATVEVTYLMTGGQFGIAAGTCVMGIKFKAINVDR